VPWFGSSQKKLLADGETAKADVVTSEPTHHVVEQGAILQLKQRTWKLLLRVHPPNQPDFDVKVDQRLDSWRLPWRGNVVDVVYDADDHSHAMLDPRVSASPPRPEWLSDPGTGTTIPKAKRAVAEAHAASDDHRADLELAASYYAEGALYDFEYQELRRRILGLPLVDPRPAIARALGPQASGAFFRSAADGHEIPLGSPDADKAVVAMTDRITRLEQLADRHDRGSISDAEFDAQKDKLLRST